MDESAQQAVQLGVNVTIFVVALTISITLLLGVRDVADVASEYNASLPTGSRVVVPEEIKKRTVSGYELLSYYSLYMTDINNERTDKFNITIIDGGNKLEAEEKLVDDEYPEVTISNIKTFFKNNGIDLSKEYEVLTEKYNEADERLEVVLKSI